MAKIECWRREEPFKSDALNLMVTANLTVITEGEGVVLVVRHVPVAQDRNENHIVSRAIISKPQWEGVKELLLAGMKKIS